MLLCSIRTDLMNEALAWGVDLKPLVEQPDLSMESFILEKISDFSNDVRGRIQGFAMSDQDGNLRAS